ncbi:hypothetical protein Dsin_019423 [Dipteronia sinensis]|uniref:RNase H type-1 domain-containing protein n=1 Tax=Dipteronia sinensis TaxID=43782 RepID=A0AAE0E2I2_9ROSI|nr:hypothetical protein Dsin_019423 [Dipteronia sinensis]
MGGHRGFSKVVCWAQNFLAEFYNNESHKERPTVGRDLLKKTYRPSYLGMYEINCDAAVDASGGFIGIGIVNRNSTGLVLVSSSQRIDVTYIAQVVEMVATNRGLLFAKELDLTPCMLEFETVVVAKWIKDMSLWIRIVEASS